MTNKRSHYKLTERMIESLVYVDGCYITKAQANTINTVKNEYDLVQIGLIYDDGTVEVWLEDSNPFMVTTRGKVLNYNHISMARLTINLINKNLPAGYELVRGEGYFYFFGGDSASWEQSGVYVNRLNDLTLEQWLDEFNYLKSRIAY